jgi:OTU domain-containing protein 6
MGVPEYKVVRQRAADFVEAHADEFAPFLDSPVEQHAATIRDTAEWGGHVELLALARAYGVKIMVMQQEGRIESIGEGDVVLWVAFYRHGFGLGEHYNSLRAKKYE